LLLAVVLVSAAASVARTLASGQDLNFDLITYHYYLGYSAFHDRLALDFLPAGAAGYQSPLPYALLYLLDSAGIAPIVNAALHACIHALNLIVLFLLTKVLIRGTAIERDRAALIAFWLLGAVAPVYWQLVGTSFADLLTSVLVLAGLWLVAEALPAHDRPGSWPTLALGASLAGAAVGMRVHNAIFVVALACALLLVHFPGRGAKGRALGVFAAAAAGAWLLCFAPWSWQVVREFGSPVFPLFNAVFAAPDFPRVNLPLVSFVPATITDALTLPFRIATYQEWVYGEKPFPDVRPALLVLGALGCALVWADRRMASRSGENAVPTRARRFVMLFFLIAAILWLATSANSRYGAALFLLAGPVCGVLLHGILPMRYVLLVVGAAVLWQAVQHQLFFKQYRWPSGPWAARYFDWELPPSLLREPAVYLSFGYQTASSLAPRVHAASRHANLVGQYSIGVDHPGRQRLQQLVDAPGGRIYGVFDYYYTQQSDPAAKSIKSYFVDHLRLWGLDFSDEPCTLVALKQLSAGWHQVNQVIGTTFRGQPPQFILCGLRAASTKDRDLAMLEHQKFERKLAPLAAACPRVLGRAISIVRVHGQWLVTSLASAEYRLEFVDDGPFHLQLLRPPYTLLTLGTVTESAILLREPDCGAWFSRLVR
jgi:hypothetical protein